MRAFNYNMVITRELLRDEDVRGLNAMRGVVGSQVVGKLLILRLDSKRDQDKVALEVSTYLRPAIPDVFLEA